MRFELTLFELFGELACLLLAFYFENNLGFLV
jgi:hypothetical protein